MYRLPDLYIHGFSSLDINGIKIDLFTARSCLTAILYVNIDHRYFKKIRRNFVMFGYRLIRYARIFICY